jgi:hypothetical protein
MRGTVLAYFVMPESMHRSPAEIHEMFVDHVPLRKWKGYKTSVEADLDWATRRFRFLPVHGMDGIWQTSMRGRERTVARGVGASDGVRSLKEYYWYLVCHACQGRRLVKSWIITHD